MLQVASFSFDASFSEIMMALCAGASLHLAAQDELLPGAPLTAVLNDQQISHVTLVPSALAQLTPAALPALQTIIVAGEACPPQLAQSWAAGRAFFNAYGPTETTVCATIMPCVEMSDAYAMLPIGHAIANSQLYILDPELQLVPVGVPGELYIGGVGVARGYLKRAGLTATKFVPNPFDTDDRAAGGRLYKTGDLARYLPDGKLEFLGRIDHQVKLRGFRIELGEIEAVLSQHPAVQEVVVTARTETSGQQRLVAYVVERPTAPPHEHTATNGTSAPATGPAAWRAFLQDKLPEYMVPSAFVVLAQFPLTPNGKIDRKALPAPDSLHLVRSSAFVAPQTETEKQLAQVWAEVLGLERVGRFDNFFELGGDSIISLQVVSRAQAKGIHLTPRQLFQEQTIADLARVAQEESLVQAEQGLVTGYLPLTPIQQWFFAHYQQNLHHFNQSVLLPVERTVAPEVLLQAISVLLTHHDGLRLRFRPSATGWQQQLSAHVPDVTLSYFTDYTQATLRPTDIVSVFNLATVAEPHHALARINHQLQASLHISNGPLLRVALIQMGPDQPDQLLWVIHHLAVDLVSWRILIPDLWTVYDQLHQGQAPQLAAKSSSVKAWATWFADYAQQAALQTELAYWRAVGAQAQPLPIDKGERQAHNTVAASARLQVALSVAETQALLQDVPAAYHTQINDILLTALALAFAEWTGQQRLVLDLEGHGRESLSDTLDLARTVGWFTALYPVCLQVAEHASNGADLGEAIKAIKEQLRQIPNKGIGYGLLRYLNETSAAQLAALPQAEVSFNYGGQFQAGQMRSLGGQLVAEHHLGHLIEINGMVVDGQLSMSWGYSQNLYEAATIEAVANGFITALRALIQHCLTPEAGGYTPSDFPLLTINQAQLERLIGRGENVAQLYPLSPMQGGMLFHTLYTPNAGTYFEQISFQLLGNLDVARFQQAWQGVLNRHSILRTGFVWQEVDAPLQIVYQQLAFPWDLQDWRGLSASEQESAHDRD